MQRKKILWLVSWYPNKNDRFDGDFIQRHARAAAIYHDVHVIFVTDVRMEKKIEDEWNYATGLTEQIIYFNRKKGIAARIKKQFAWKKAFQEAVKNYIEKNGLPDCVHVHVPWKAGLIALWIKKKYKKDFILTEHWGMYSDTAENNFYGRSDIARKLLKKIFNNSKALVTVSRYLASGIEKITGKKTDTILPNVVDTTLFFFKDQKYSKFTFIHVSNMVKLKNVDIILEAFKNVVSATEKETQLIMIGNRNDDHVRLADRLGLLNTSVFFKGEISYVQVAEEMRRSHCLVLFSDSETFSCVAAEALCCGIPVISSNVGALPELIDATNGTLVPIKDKEALAIAMVEMTAKYYHFDHKRIAEEACKKFSYSTVAQKFDELYIACGDPKNKNLV
jgi:glycosyltransferase involved in cell wall biosynthesis